MLKRIVGCFELSSGLKINMAKTTMVGWVVHRRYLGH